MAFRLCVCVCVCMCVCVHAYAQSCPAVCYPMDYSPPAPLSMTIPGKSTRVGCHFLLQGIFPTHELSPHLLHWQADSLSLCLQGSPGNLYKILFFSSLCPWTVSKVGMVGRTYVSTTRLGVRNLWFAWFCSQVNQRSSWWFPSTLAFDHTPSPFPC